VLRSATFFDDAKNSFKFPPARGSADDTYVVRAIDTSHFPGGNMVSIKRSVISSGRFFTRIHPLIKSLLVPLLVLGASASRAVPVVPASTLFRVSPLSLSLTPQSNLPQEVKDLEQDSFRKRL